MTFFLSASWLQTVITIDVPVIPSDILSSRATRVANESNIGCISFTGMYSDLQHHCPEVITNQPALNVAFSPALFLRLEHRLCGCFEHLCKNTQTGDKSGNAATNGSRLCSNSTTGVTNCSMRDRPWPRPCSFHGSRSRKYGHKKQTLNKSVCGPFFVQLESKPFSQTLIFLLNSYSFFFFFSGFIANGSVTWHVAPTFDMYVKNITEGLKEKFDIIANMS